jgi:hypothetical protein
MIYEKCVCIKNKKKMSLRPDSNLYNFRPIKFYDMQYIFNTILANYLTCISKDMKDFSKVQQCLKNSKYCPLDIMSLKSNIDTVYELTLQLYGFMTNYTTILETQRTQNEVFKTYLQRKLNKSLETIQSIDIGSKIDEMSISNIFENLKNMLDVNDDSNSTEDIFKNILQSVKKAQNELKPINIPDYKIQLQVDPKNYGIFLYKSEIFKKIFKENQKPSIHEIVFIFKYFDCLCLINTLSEMRESMRNLGDLISKEFCNRPENISSIPNSVFLPDLKDCLSCPCNKNDEKVCSQCNETFKTFRYKYYGFFTKLVESYIPSNILKNQNPTDLLNFLNNIVLPKLQDSNSYIFSTKYQPLKLINFIKCNDFGTLFNANYFSSYITIIDVDFMKYLRESYVDVDTRDLDKRVDDIKNESKQYLKVGKPDDPLPRQLLKKGTTRFDSKPPVHTPTATPTSTTMGTRKRRKTHQQTVKKVKKVKKVKNPFY